MVWLVWGRVRRSPLLLHDPFPLSLSLFTISREAYLCDWGGVQKSYGNTAVLGMQSLAYMIHTKSSLYHSTLYILSFTGIWGGVRIILAIRLALEYKLDRREQWRGLIWRRPDRFLMRDCMRAFPNCLITMRVSHATNSRPPCFLALARTSEQRSLPVHFLEFEEKVGDLLEFPSVIELLIRINN
jgi:hypothetical protein